MDVSKEARSDTHTLYYRTRKSHPGSIWTKHRCQFTWELYQWNYGLRTRPVHAIQLPRKGLRARPDSTPTYNTPWFENGIDL